MIHARSYAPLGLTALAGVAVVIASRGGLDLGLDTGGLRHGISFTTASALALVTLAGVSIVGRGAPVSASSGALALGALAALASSPTLLVLAGSLAAGAHPAVIAALSAATAVGGVPDRLDGLNADHALGIVLGLFGLLSARGPLAPLSLLITTSLVAPALWASGWGRVALISGGVGLATLTAIGAALDKSRSASCLGWAWVGLGLAAMGAAAAPLGLALGLSGLGLAAMCEQTAADDPARPSPWAIGLGALAAGGGAQPGRRRRARRLAGADHLRRPDRRGGGAPGERRDGLLFGPRAARSPLPRRLESHRRAACVGSVALAEPDGRRA